MSEDTKRDTVWNPGVKQLTDRTIGEGESGIEIPGLPSIVCRIRHMNRLKSRYRELAIIALGVGGLLVAILQNGKFVRRRRPVTGDRGNDEGAL